QVHGHEGHHQGETHGVDHPGEGDEPDAPVQGEEGSEEVLLARRPVLGRFLGGCDRHMEKPSRRERAGSVVALRLYASAMRFFEKIHGVYFDDLDAFQILHNAKYVLLIERTIGAFWDQVCGWKGLLEFEDNPDQSQLVRSNHIEYERPVKGV